jgi:hypothetical protein
VGSYEKTLLKSLKIKEKNKISFYILGIFFLEKCQKNKCVGVMKNNRKDVNYV